MGKEELVIYCDGGSRGNPGPAASAFVVMHGNKQIACEARYLGVDTNNMAEYSALSMAINWIYHNQDKYRGCDFLIIMDSELVVKQINGIYKIRNEKLKVKVKEIKKLIEQIQSRIVVSHVRRHNNKLADQLVNNKLDEQLV